MLQNIQTEIECKKLGLNADNEIKMIIKNTNKPIQTTLKYQELQEFGSW